MRFEWTESRNLLVRRSEARSFEMMVHQHVLWCWNPLFQELDLGDEAVHAQLSGFTTVNVPLGLRHIDDHDLLQAIADGRAQTLSIDLPSTEDSDPINPDVEPLE
jgi:hypothetical protein